MNLDFKYQILLSYYKELLTSKQKQILEMYYEQNLTIVEISKNLNTTKEAVFDLIKRVKKKLDTYEEKLQLYKKSNKIEEILNNNNINQDIINIIIELI